MREEMVVVSDVADRWVLEAFMPGLEEIADATLKLKSDELTKAEASEAVDEIRPTVLVEALRAFEGAKSGDPAHSEHPQNTHRGEEGEA